jgi:hypothetical protein
MGGRHCRRLLRMGRAEVIAAAHVVEGILGYLVVGCGVVIVCRVIGHVSESSPVVGELSSVCGSTGRHGHQIMPLEPQGSSPS